jgi:hypothetical protein
LFVYPPAAEILFDIVPKSKIIQSLNGFKKKNVFFKNGYKYIFVFFNLVSIFFFGCTHRHLKNVDC